MRAIGVTNGCVRHSESNALLIMINVRGKQMVAIKMHNVNREENASIIDAEREMMKKIDPIRNIVRKTNSVTLVFASHRFQNVLPVSHLAQLNTAIKNSNTLTNRVIVTWIVNQEVTATEFQVNEIRVVRTKISRIDQMVNSATSMSNVLQDVVQRITFAEPKYQTGTVVKATGQTVNLDMTIMANVSNANHTVTVHVDNNVTDMFAELLSVVPVIGLDVMATVDIGTVCTPKQGMQVSAAITDVQELVRHKIATLDGHRVRMDGNVEETMDVQVVTVIMEDAKGKSAKDADAAMIKNVQADTVTTTIAQQVVEDTIAIGSKNVPEVHHVITIGVSTIRRITKVIFHTIRHSKYLFFSILHAVLTFPLSICDMF